MLVFLIAAVIATPPSALDAAYARVLDDDSLMKSINESAAQPLLCISQLLKSKGLIAVLGPDERTQCRFDAEIEKAARTIRGRFPDISASLAKGTAAKYLGQIRLYNSLMETAESSK